MEVDRLIPWLGAALVVAATYLGVGWWCKHAPRWGWVDVPNHRSAHTTPTPTSAGVVVMMAWSLWALAWVAAGKLPTDLWQLVALNAALAAVNLCDDRSELKPSVRLGAQALVAGLWIGLVRDACSITLDGMTLPMGVTAPIWAWLSLVWSVNVYNFQDGMDGLATSQALLIFGGMAMLLMSVGAWAWAALCVGMVAACLGFLPFNWPPARCFLGDVGSCSLGFLVTALAFATQRWVGMSALLWPVLYSSFIVDATITLIRRIKAGHRPWEPHREHASARLLRSGWSPRRVLATWWSWQMVVVLAMVAWRCHALSLLGLVVFSWLWQGLYLVGVERRCPMHQRG